MSGCQHYSATRLGSEEHWTCDYCGRTLTKDQMNSADPSPMQTYDYTIVSVRRYPIKQQVRFFEEGVERERDAIEETWAESKALSALGAAGWKLISSTMVDNPDLEHETVTHYLERPRGESNGDQRSFTDKMVERAQQRARNDTIRRFADQVRSRSTDPQ